MRQMFRQAVSALYVNDFGVSQAALKFLMALTASDSLLSPTSCHSSMQYLAAQGDIQKVTVFFSLTNKSGQRSSTFL